MGRTKNHIPRHRRSLRRTTCDLDGSTGAMSTPQGRGLKPLKYPAAVTDADLVLLNKVDLLPHVNFSRPVFERQIHQLAPAAHLLEICSVDSDSLSAWIEWIVAHALATEADHCGSMHDPDVGLFYG